MGLDRVEQDQGSCWGCWQEWEGGWRKVVLSFHGENKVIKGLKECLGVLSTCYLPDTGPHTLCVCELADSPKKPQEELLWLPPFYGRSVTGSGSQVANDTVGFRGSLSRPLLLLSLYRLLLGWRTGFCWCAQCVELSFYFGGLNLLCNPGMNTCSLCLSPVPLPQ